MEKKSVRGQRVRGTVVRSELKTLRSEDNGKVMGSRFEGPRAVQEWLELGTSPKSWGTD